MLSQMRNVISRVSNAVGGIRHEEETVVNQNKDPVYGRLHSPLYYRRPHFLGLSKEEEQVVSDHKTRQIVAPKDNSLLPFKAGYCEVINAGKSTLNEDCAVALTVVLDSLTNEAGENHYAESAVEENQIESSASSSIPMCDNHPSESDPSLENRKKDDELASSLKNQAKEVENAVAEDITNDSADRVTGPSELHSRAPVSGDTGDAVCKSEMPNIDDAKTEADVSKKTMDDLSEQSGENCESIVTPIKSIKLEVPSESKSLPQKCRRKCKTLRLDYFAVFDGHAGEGAAVYASNVLHEILIEKLREVQHLLLIENSSNPRLPASLSDSDPSKRNSLLQADSLITGLLQEVMLLTDNHLKVDQERYQLCGGCTALVVVFILDKMFVAGAGDSRAILCRPVFPADAQYAAATPLNDGSSTRAIAIPMSQDFTPTTERRRLQYLAYIKPSLLADHFTRLEFIRRVTQSDLGKKVLYRDYHMTGWIYKEVTRDDLKCPMMSGLGKSKRLLGTIGVTRGLGDHNLIAFNQLEDSPIKPFMSAVPEVRMYDLSSREHHPNDVLVMASDGLWDMLSSEEVARRVTMTLQQLDEDNPERYCIAAKDLVLTARGCLSNRLWRMSDNKPASIDDISVFVIPMLGASEKHP